MFFVTHQSFIQYSLAYLFRDYEMIYLLFNHKK